MARGWAPASFDRTNHACAVMLLLSNLAYACFSCMLVLPLIATLSISPEFFDFSSSWPALGPFF
eukprot:651649-Pleurochrysis_carterae.AAC.1